MCIFYFSGLFYQLIHSECNLDLHLNLINKRRHTSCFEVPQTLIKLEVYRDFVYRSLWKREPSSIQEHPLGFRFTDSLKQVGWKNNS